MLDQLLPDVQQLAKAVMGALDDGKLQSLLDILSIVPGSADDVRDDLPPPATRRAPPASAAPKRSGQKASPAWTFLSLLITPSSEPMAPGTNLFSSSQLIFGKIFFMQ